MNKTERQKHSISYYFGVGIALILSPMIVILIALASYYLSQVTIIALDIDLINSLIIGFIFQILFGIGYVTYVLCNKPSITPKESGELSEIKRRRMTR